MTQSSNNVTRPQSSPFKPRITVFHCINALGNRSLSSNGRYEVTSVKLPCSSMIREVFLLRAFEAGADAVIVLACPEAECRNIDGSLRAAKRVARMKKMVDEIGLDGRRLNIYTVASGDGAGVAEILDKTAKDTTDLGPNPAA